MQPHRRGLSGWIHYAQNANISINGPGGDTLWLFWFKSIRFKQFLLLISRCHTKLWALRDTESDADSFTAVAQTI